MSQLFLGKDNFVNLFEYKKWILSTSVNMFN